MSFVEPAFPVFLLVVLALYWCLPRRAQNVLLAVASSVFYGWIHPWFLLLLAYSTLLNFGSALALRRFPARRTAVLVLCIAGNLLLLGVFKYFDFFVENVVAAAALVGVPLGARTLGILLPVGISFFTFQTLGYTLDVARGKLEPRTDLLDFYTFVAFFPQLVAGPIERGDNLLVQVERPRTWSWSLARAGVGLALWGAFKKVAVADGLAPYVDLVFLDPDPSWAMIWAAALGFMVQLLADFGGYTDIARGTARLFGFELVENFRAPYLAKSPTDLWDRWHVSLSHWLRDHVYYPLASSRWARDHLVLPFVRTPRRFHVYRGVLGTMLLSGLWHGAAWHFVLWGLFYGVVQVAHLEAQWVLPRRWSEVLLAPAVGVPLMFGVQLVAVLIFREPDVTRLFGYLVLDPTAGTDRQWMAAAVMFAVSATGGAVMTAGFGWTRQVEPRLRGSALSLPVETAGWAALAWGIFLLYRPVTSDFIYFAF